MFKLKHLLRFLSLLLCNFSLSAQQSSKVYGIIIKGGHVIDPKNNIDEVIDVALNDGRIALIAKNINADQATQVVDAAGMYVAPGLIDIHSRLGYTLPDGYTFRVGVTTIVDAGDSDYESFSNFKKQIIDRSTTRVLAFLNIKGGDYKGGANEKNTGDKIASESAKAGFG
jgi:dihydroorotase